jgi:putative sterol carrier protein
MMAGLFPEERWVASLIEKLNSDPDYARIAHKWEGDLMFVIEPDDQFPNHTFIYMDLWHGKCREAVLLSNANDRQAAFVISGPYSHFNRVLAGEWHPMQTLLTRKLHISGNMAYLMRNMPTVIDFVRCCQEVTSA